MKFGIIRTGFLTLWFLGHCGDASAQTTRPATQAAVGLCEQRYSDGQAYSAAPIIIDGVTDKIRWLRPATCRRLLGYVTGANQVADRDGENPKLIGTAWRDVDARRFDLARDSGLLVARGVQASGSYTPWRWLTDNRRPLGLVLPRHDARRLAEGGWDGAMLDNLNGSPLVEQGGSFVTAAGEYVDAQTARDAQATYVLEFRMWWRVEKGRECYLLGNVSRPQVWYGAGAAKPIDVAQAWPRTLAWLTACGFDAVMLELKPQYMPRAIGDTDEAKAWRAFADAWKATGRDLVLKRLAARYYTAEQLTQFDAYAASMLGPNVYLSWDP